MTLRRKRIDFSGPTAILVLLIFLFLGCPPLHAASDTPDPNTGSGIEESGGRETGGGGRIYSGCHCREAV